MISKIEYWYNGTLVNITYNAPAVPRIGDKVCTENNRFFEVVNVMWYLGNKTWVKIKME